MLRKLLNISKDIEIEWSYPKLFSSVLHSEDAFNWGIYQITTKIGKNEDLLYIGKAWQNFNHRISKHNREWLHLYEGEKYLRFGYLNTRVTESQLLEIESAIIFELNPVHNRQCKKTYNPSDEYDIYSKGYRGKVPDFIRTKNH